jgi:hypothetical protein
MSYSNLLKNIYNTTNKDLSLDILKSEKVGSYPQRILFEYKWHNIFKDNKSILKQNSKNIDEDMVDDLLNLKTIDISYLKDSKIDFDKYLQKNSIDMIPMYIKVKK